MMLIKTKKEKMGRRRRRSRVKAMKGSKSSLDRKRKPAVP